MEANETLQYISSHAKFGEQNYPNAQDCDWTIEAPPGTNIRLAFSGFELEEEPGCEYDYVEVFAGYDDSSASYGKYCGSKVGLRSRYIITCRGSSVPTKVTRCSHPVGLGLVAAVCAPCRLNMHRRIFHTV